MSSSKFSLEGRVALVTGAGGVLGMGRATALAFAEAGADVAVTDLIVKADNWDLEGTAEEIRKLGRRSLAVQADVTKRNEVDNLVQKTVQELGTVDILANVAGVPSSAAFMEMTPELWAKGIDINLSSVLHCCQAAGKVMMEQKRGSIINWSSSAAYQMGVLSVYGIAKIGIRHLTGWVARDLGPYNVRCNAVAPGLIATDFGFVGVDGDVNDDGRPHPRAGRSDRVNTIPLGRMGDAGDVADVAVFLASDASRYVTGVTIPVGGGVTMI
ncbi:MAG: SDR family oxidoreductase [Dehalococcoidales bacterium]|nr:MAG: SDR family oxidoreductase [Dehalococcoidales bacterium]